MQTNHKRPNSESREWASLYALRLLAPAELAAYEKHLERGCAVCQREVRALGNVAGLIAYAAEPQAPASGVRARVLDSTRPPGRTGGPPEAISLDAGGLLIANSNEIPWEEAGISGCSRRLLFEDSVRKYHTSLVRMDPGTIYPGHRHLGIEELYLLEGDLVVEGHTMHAGDYCRAEKGSVHGEIRTESGCRFIAMASLEDELLSQT